MLMISTSEVKITVLIDEKFLELAMRVLKKSFGFKDVRKQAYDSIELTVLVDEAVVR